jgi:diguanylate cyclase (GGDEF)-like protein
MLALLLVAAIATIIGVRAVVDEVRGTAHQLHEQSVTVATLRTDLVAHEEVAHRLLSDEPVDRSAFMRQQDKITREFAAAIVVFPNESGLRTTVVEAQTSWQRGLTAYGLWGTQVKALKGDHSADNPTFGASSDATDALLDGLEGPSLDAMDRGLNHGANLELVLIIVLTGLFGLALGVTVYFRRRMVKDLVRPVASMHQGVLRLQAGDYHHRISVARRDELGELAEAFNGMASALQDTHLALTLRATHDSLTGLANRAALTDRLMGSFGAETGGGDQWDALLFIDIDDFKDVNDSVGHEGGDELLVLLAERLKDCVRPCDLVARLGGDEFAIVVREDEGPSPALHVADRIMDALSRPFFVGGAYLDVTVSIGITQQTSETGDAAELLRQADFAMYMAKGAGKARYQTFDAQIQTSMLNRSAANTDLAGSGRGAG